VQAEIEGIQAQADTGSGISARIKQLGEQFLTASLSQKFTALPYLHSYAFQA